MEGVGFADMGSNDFIINLQTYPSVFQSERENLDEGDKVIMPDKVIRDLMHGFASKKHLPNPVIFRIENKAMKKVSHCGVLEFNSLHLNAFVPQWMMDNLLVEPGDVCTFTLVENFCTLCYIKLEPLTNEFVEDFENPRNTLECAFRKFTVLTLNDTILIRAMKKNYTFHVSDINPKMGDVPFGCIINSDLQVEFATPLQIANPPLLLRENSPFLNKTNEKCPIHFVFEAPKDFSGSLELTLTSDGGDADLYVSKSCKKPSAIENDWENYSNSKTKKIVINADGGCPRTLFGTVDTIKKDAEVDFTLSFEITQKTDLMGDEKQLGAESGPDVVQGQKCENCRRLIAESTFVLHSLRCRRMFWYCEKCQKCLAASQQSDHFHCVECDLPFSADELRKHSKLKHDLITCGCGEQFYLLDRPKHLANCSLSTKNCKFCEAPHLFAEIDSHESACGGRTRNCDFCGELVPIRNMRNHCAAEHGINPCSREPAAVVPGSGSVEEMMVEQAIRESLKYSLEANGKKDLSAPDREGPAPVPTEINRPGQRSFPPIIFYRLPLL